MKNLIVLIILIFIAGCSSSSCDKNLENVSVVEGVISAIDVGNKSMYGVPYRPTVLYIQTAKQTTKVEIPLESSDNWRVGDYTVLVVQKYNVVKKQDK